MSTSPDLGIPFVSAQQLQPEVTHNEAVQLLAILANGVLSFGGNTPAVSPTEGDSYIVGTAPTGAWAGRANTVAISTSSGWRFIPDRNSSGTIITMGARHEGIRVWVRDLDALWYWTGSAWAEFFAPATISGHYGSLGITGNASTLAITAAVDGTLGTTSDYVQIAGIWDAIPHGANNGIIQHTNDLEILRAGTYQLSFWASVSCDTLNTQAAIRFRVEGAATTFAARYPKFFMGAAADIVGVSASGIFHFDAGDKITMWAATNKSVALLIEQGSFTLHEVETD
jgi:hypothetical protein